MTTCMGQIPQRAADMGIIEDATWGEQLRTQKCPQQVPGIDKSQLPSCRKHSQRLLRPVKHNHRKFGCTRTRQFDSEMVSTTAANHAEKRGRKCIHKHTHTYTHTHQYVCMCTHIYSQKIYTQTHTHNERKYMTTKNNRRQQQGRIMEAGMATQGVADLTRPPGKIFWGAASRTKSKKSAAVHISSGITSTGGCNHTHIHEYFIFTQEGLQTTHAHHTIHTALTHTNTARAFRKHSRTQTRQRNS